MTPGEGHIFHNRLTHSLEVAQLARRLAEKIIREQPPKILDRLGGLDPEVAEAAALAHDLGHPPFGHIAERELDSLVRKAGVPDGFEGNPQSFRIVCRLSAHRTGYRGLNLARATLNAILKYPHLRAVGNKASKRYEKFGSYRTESHFLHFARAGRGRSVRQSLEASIMDVADDIAYSVHDFDDFYRAGILSVQHLRYERAAFDAFLDRWAATGRIKQSQISRHRDALQDFLKVTLFQAGPYGGGFQERASQRTMTSNLINEYVNAVRLDKKSGITVEEDKLIEQKFLQRVVWEQVITNPALATLQHGQRNIVQYLFKTYVTAAQHRDTDLLPAVYQDLLPTRGKRSPRHRKPTQTEVRVAADIVSSFTDLQALHLYRKLSGTDPGSITDLISG